MEEINKNEPQITKRQQTAILATMIIIAFITTFTASAVNLAIPGISIEFNSKATVTGWIITTYILVTAMLAVPFGRIADLTGRRRLFILGVFFFMVFSFLAAFATSIEMLIVTRVIIGIAGAMIFATNTAILVTSFPREQTGKVLGLSVMFTYIGLSLGPVVGGIITHNLGWRSIFYITAFVTLIALIIAWIGIPKKISNKASQVPITLKEVNPLGILLYAVMIFALIFGFTETSVSLYGWGIVVFGIILLFVFIRHEMKTERPILELRLFKNNPNFIFSNLASLLNYGATFAVSYLLSIYLQIIVGYDAQVAGFILISQPILQAIVSPIAGRMSDKYSPFKLASAGMGLCAIGLFSYIFVDANTPLIHIIINMVIMGVGFGLFSSPNSNAIMSSVAPKDSSVASSMMATMRSLGHVISMSIITLIISAHLGDSTFEQAPNDEIIATMRTGFIVFTVICIIGVVCSMQRKTEK